MINRMTANIINFKIKKDSPIQLEYSVNNGVFLMSISFQSDVTAIKIMLHLIVKSVYSIWFPFSVLRDIDKNFIDKYSKDVITQSV